jgi:hypothetical protein
MPGVRVSPLLPARSVPQRSFAAADPISSVCTATPPSYTIFPPSHPDTSSIRIATIDSTSGAPAAAVPVSPQRIYALMMYSTTMVRFSAMCFTAVGAIGVCRIESRSTSPGSAAARAPMMPPTIA